MKHQLKKLWLVWNMGLVIPLLAQSVPTDSTLLKSIYGGYDEGGKSFTREVRPWENVVVLYDSIVYKVTFKQVIKLAAKELLLVCTAAPISDQHKHVLGYWESYAFKRVKDKWVKDPTWRVDSNRVRVLGDDTLRYKVVNIGKTKKALIETWESKGRMHYQKNIEILGLGSNEISDQGRIQIGFSNLEWEGATEDGYCLAEKIESDYEIVPSAKEWCDIKLHTYSYTYGKDCNGLILNKLEEVLWVNNGKGYLSKHTKTLPLPKTE